MKKSPPLEILSRFAPAIRSIAGILFASELKAAPESIPTDAARMVDAATMQRVCDEAKTPRKHGVIIKGENDGELADCARLFCGGGHWRMMYAVSGKRVGLTEFDNRLVRKPIQGIPKRTVAEKAGRARRARRE